MDFSPEHLSCGPMLVLGGRDARQENRGKLEPRILHPQRFKDVIGAVDIKRLTGDARDKFAKNDKIDVAIDETRHRRKNGFFLFNHPDGFHVT